MGEDGFLQTPLQRLKGVGPRRAADLRRVGLSTVEDLLYRFPFRFEDRSRLSPIVALRPKSTVTVAGEIVRCGPRRTRRPGFSIFELLLRDSTGAVHAVWLNQPFLRDVFQRGQHVILYGVAEAARAGGIQLTNPQYEIVEEEDGPTIHTGRIVPVYEKVGSLTPKMQRRLVHEVLGSLPAALEDPLPEHLRARLNLPDRRTALLGAHFPEAGAPLDPLNTFRAPAQVRLIFEELFLFQAGVLLRRRQAGAEWKPFAVTINDRIREAARQVLPFRLTRGQKQALGEIVADMRRPQPMNRLLQGDVGAGKTIVALLAALVALENGLQVAVMAPTEILAEQHFLNVRRLFESSRFRIGLVTGGVPDAARRDLLEGLAAGALHLVVGTHALIEGQVAFAALGLVIIDEQHRFGVLQRATLRTKAFRPDVLVMTATPIPRTLALTAYGDLDVSVIRELPPGRQPVTTIVKPESTRTEVYDFVKAELDKGRQAYVVFPLVEESAKLDLRAATEMADHLAQNVFQAYRVALLHGRMKPDARDRVMRAFAAGSIDVLVATTVIEVGVDVANASVMVVEHAERFGLSQLHQLRGRVGRDRHQSYCLLLFQPPLPEQARARLKALTETGDGFVIAERDLEIRGPGDFFGTRQSGAPTFRAADLVRDRPLLEEARREAETWLADPASGDLAGVLERAWEQRFGLAGVG